MRALVQRVHEASVALPGGERRRTGRGLLVFLGVGKGDGEPEARRLADKLLSLRVFPNDAGKFDRSVGDVSGEILVIPQFTLYGDPWAGRRPDFTRAAPPAQARALYESFAARLAASGLVTRTGEFGAAMTVDSSNDGPVTLWLDTA